MVNRVAEWPAARMAHWADESWWQARIDDAIADSDPAIVNARITLLHRELALALAQILGTDVAPTYHAWAVWASLKAGRTIREEEGRWTRWAAPLAGFTLCSAAALTALGVRGARTTIRTGSALGAGVLAAIVGRSVTGRALSRASKAILAGNVTVIDDVGRHSARFACAFAREEDRTPEALAVFLNTLSPEPSSHGGQSLLRDAYHQWFRAARESDPDRRDEAMLLGNLSALIHEHWRLQTFFVASIPRPLSHLVTARALAFQMGEQLIDVGRDVPPNGVDIYPDTLATIESPELRDLLTEWDRTPNTPGGSGARDWREIGDRINFIADLFRTRLHDPGLWLPPYEASEQARILAASAPREHGE